MYEKSIIYDRETRDYAMYLDGELAGIKPTYHAAEVALDLLVFELMTGQFFRAEPAPAPSVIVVETETSQPKRCAYCSCQLYGGKCYHKGCMSAGAQPEETAQERADREQAEQASEIAAERRNEQILSGCY